MRMEKWLAAVVLGVVMALPVGAADEPSKESPGLFSRTWHSVKEFFGAAKEDTKDAAQTVGGAAVEGGRRAANAGKAVGKAFTEGAKDVKDAVVTPSEGPEEQQPRPEGED